ncbi:MAG: amidohydrolase [Planctomycetota bacterium]
MSPHDAMNQIDALVAHVWMVRTFLKHCEELDEDDDLRVVHRACYDYPLALGEAWKNQDAAAYLRQAKRKLRKLREASELFAEIQPEVSTHTNFEMAVRSLHAAVNTIDEVITSIAAKSKE